MTQFITNQKFYEDGECLTAEMALVNDPIGDWIITILGILVFIVFHVVLFLIGSVAALLALPFAVFQSREGFKRNWPAPRPHIAKHGIRAGGDEKPVASIVSRVKALRIWVITDWPVAPIRPSIYTDQDQSSG